MWFLYLRTDFEWKWSRYVATNSNNWDSLLTSGSDVVAILSAINIYWLMLSLLKAGAFSTHKKEWKFGLPRTWNLTHTAWYLAFPSGPSKAITWKNTSFLHWKCPASKTDFKLRKEHWSKKSILSVSSFLCMSLFNVAIIDIDSFYF